MRRPLRRVGVAGALAATATAAGAATTASVQRRRARRRWQATDATDRLGGLRGEATTVIADDGVPLHVEVDEPATVDPTAPTLVLVHGWMLNLDCWHLQRLALRSSYRLVSYDQRCHGRSGSAEATSCTVEQLADDLEKVIEVAAPEGPLVLVGHSMGGMATMEYAKQHPQIMKDRVVGLALLGTSAGDLGQVLPGRVGRLLKARSPSLLALGARAPRVVHAGRRITGGPAYWVTKHLAFGDEVPPEYAAFADAMLSSTEASAFWNFWPLIAGLDEYASLAAFDGIPTLVVVGSRDMLTPVRHAYRIAELVPDSRVVVLERAGHLIMVERADEVTKLIEDLVASR